MALAPPDPLAISLLVRWLLGWLLCQPMPALPDLAPSGEPRVSVLIPARNEAFTLPRLLQALAKQSLRPLEVIVIDDQTTPATPPQPLRPPPASKCWHRNRYQRDGAAKPGRFIKALRQVLGSYLFSSMPTPNPIPASWPA